MPLSERMCYQKKVKVLRFLLRIIISINLQSIKTGVFQLFLLVFGVFAIIQSVPAADSTIKNLEVRYSKGQVFITFDEINDPNLFYYVFKNSNPISDVTEAKFIASLPYGSGINRHTSTISKEDFLEVFPDELDQNNLFIELIEKGYINDWGAILPRFWSLIEESEMQLSSGYSSQQRVQIFNILNQAITTFVIVDEGPSLSRGKALLVYTSQENGRYYYAVTTSLNNHVIPRVNSVSVGIQEDQLEIPGAVQIAPPQPLNPIQTLFKFFAWEDYKNWNHDHGYYGHRFNIVVSEPLPLDKEKQYPLTLILHGGGSFSYQEPEVFVGSLERPERFARGISLTTRDPAFRYGFHDPYTNTERRHSRWLGYRTDDIIQNYTERRLKRYAEIATADPRFHIDTNRIYIRGVSMGGAGTMHFAYHFPHFIAAAAPTIGWINLNRVDGEIRTRFGCPEEMLGIALGCSEIAKPINSHDGPSVWDWESMSWIINLNPPFLPPIIHTFRKDDPIVDQIEYPDLLRLTEEKKYAHISKWQDGGHQLFYLKEDHHIYYRYRLDEAYPAFSNASSSSSFDDQEGQRNLGLDWSSSHHDLFEGTQDDIVDELDNFSMTFLAVAFESIPGIIVPAQDTQVDVTIRNAQEFFVSPGMNVYWENRNITTNEIIESGEVKADNNGLVTISVLVTTTGNRLSLTCPECSISSHGKKIKLFYLPDVIPIQIGTINHQTKSIHLTIPSTVDSSSLRAIVKHTGSSITPESGQRIDFSSPVEYTISHRDNTTENYTVFVTNAQNKAPITSSSVFLTTENSKVNIALSFIDPDSGPAPYSVTIVDQPKFGSLEGSDTDWTYLPNEGYIGFDTFRWKVNDGHYDSNSSTTTIAIYDEEPPLISNCPENVTENLDIGTCSKSVFWTEPSADDNVPGVLLTSSHIPGNLFPAGESTITYQAKDRSGNISYCHFSISLIHPEIPNISECPSNITRVNEPEKGGAKVIWGSPIVEHQCPEFRLGATHQSESFFSFGTTIVEYYYHTSDGRNNACSFEVDIDFQLNLQEGWNAISMPVEPELQNTELFTDTISGSVWQWKNKRYEPVSQMALHTGYWLFSTSDKSVVIKEFSQDPKEEQLTLKKGWNLIGLSQSVTNPYRKYIQNTIWHWQNNKYKATNRFDENLRLGKGYWIHSGDEETYP